MKRQNEILTQKKTQPSLMRRLWPRAAVRATAGHDKPSPRSAETGFGHDFSQIAMRPPWLLMRQGCATSSCGLVPQRCPLGGACHTCPPQVQARFRIGPIRDKYEQEADRVAGQVMGIPEPRTQFDTRDAITSRVAPRLNTSIQALQGRGRSLSAAERSFFEPRFGTDFSHVRLHHGAQAAGLARSINAQAFTLGREIVLGAEAQASTTWAGRRLLAHELTHVVQQNGTRPVHGGMGRNQGVNWGAGAPASADAPMHAGFQKGMVQKKAAILKQTFAGMAGGLDEEEMTLAQHIRREGQPMIQRTAVWKAGAVHETINLATMALNGAPTPITWHMLNGTKMETEAAAVGAINSPTVTTAKSGADWKAKITAVPANTGSFDETVLASGPWNRVVPKATVGTKFGLAVCSGAGDTTFRAKGDPSDNDVFTANRGHEDQHAADHQAAFNAKIGTWDTKATEAKTKGTEFVGPTEADATANLWAAMGGTPADVAKAYRVDGFTRGAAFHATARGGPMSISNPQSDKTCATSSVNVTNPFK